MKHVFILAFSLGAAWVMPAHAADQMRDRVQTTEQSRMQDREQIYGSELMTSQERYEYHNRMRALKTEQERETFRLEHHTLMQERAKTQGKTLPAMPPAGTGSGMMGPGMGQGSGMGPGPRR